MVDDNKKGPVRPPILDAEPKNRSSASDQSAKSEKPSEKPASATNPQPAEEKPKDGGTTSRKADEKPKSPPAPTEESSGTGTFIAAILLSAGLGIAGTAGLAYYKVFPFNQWAEQSALAPEIAKLQKRIFDLENAQGPDLASFATQNDLAALQTQLNEIDTSQIEQAIANIEQQLATMNTDNAETAPIDLGPIESAVATLEQDVADLRQTQAQLAQGAAQNSADNSTQPVAADVDLGPIEQRLNDQLAQLNALQENMQTESEQLATLAEGLSELQGRVSALADDQSAREAADSALAAARLPILLSEIDAAIQKGRPFAAYLQELADFLNVMPDDQIMAIAETGVVPAASLAGQFASLRPELLAARPGVPTDAPWQDKLLGAVKDAVNLRPLDAEGNDPLIILDQIEIALASENFADAGQAIAQLPDPMQQVAAPLAQNIDQHLALEQWQADIRTNLLARSQTAQGDAQ